MPSNRSGVYQIRCLINNKIYIGSTSNFSIRWRQHRDLLSKRKHHAPYLQHAWEKHGEDQFVFEELEVIPNEKSLLIEAEQRHLDLSMPCNPKIGYNVSPTAGSRLGAPCSPETRALLSEINTGKRRSSETRAKISENTKASWRDQGFRDKVLKSNKVRKQSYKNYIEILGETKSLVEWSKISGINANTLRARIRDGVTGEAMLVGPRKHGIELTPKSLARINLLRSWLEG